MKKPKPAPAKTRLITAAHAQRLLIRAGVCPRDAYDLLADAGMEPHPDAPTVRISLDRLILEFQLWLQRAAADTANFLA